MSNTEKPENPQGKVRTRDELSSISSNESPQRPAAKVPKMAADPVSMDTILSIISDMKMNMKTLNETNALLNKELEEVKAGLSMQNSLVEELKREKAEMQTKVNNLESALSKNNAHLVTVENNVQENEIKIESLEMYTRKNSLEIVGIPEARGEDLEEIVTKVADAVGVELDADEIDIVHRLPVKIRGIRPVIVKFKSHKTKSQIYFSRRKLRGTEFDEEEFYAKDIYINENLTAYRRRLYAEARKRAKINKWFKTWTTDGKIFITKTKGEPAFKINNYSDLESMYV